MSFLILLLSFISLSKSVFSEPCDSIYSGPQSKLTSIGYSHSVAERIKKIYPQLADYISQYAPYPEMMPRKLYYGFGYSWQTFKTDVTSLMSVREGIRYDSYNIFKQSREYLEGNSHMAHDPNKWYMLQDPQIASNYAHRVRPFSDSEINAYYLNKSRNKLTSADVFVAEFEIPRFILTVKTSTLMGMSWVIDRREFINITPFIKRVALFHIPDVMNIRKPLLRDDDSAWLDFNEAWSQ